MAEAAAHPSWLVFRHVLQSRLERVFRRGDRVADVGAGGGGDVGGVRGDDALFLAARGVRVASLGDGGDPFDGAYAGLGALDGADLRAVGSALAFALRPDAPVVLSLRGASPLPAWTRRLLTGLGSAGRSAASVAEAQRVLGPAFEWTDSYALGALLPGPEHESWPLEHPQAFGVIAALERAVRRWPGLRGRGEYVVMEGRRR